ncbi:hypothetical protein [Rubrivirga sp.]|uniref:hypothetical protein n=1 Tax=Rubrivirga sp. TaxID=1885344 RepID=UPI003B5165A2
MLIDRTILNEHLHRAAVEQYAREYESRGFEIERGATVGDLRVDLLARKDGEVHAFEFRVNDPKQRDPGFAQRWEERVRGQLGAGKIHLVYVPYPSITKVDAPELEEAIPRWVQERHADVLDAVVPGPKQVWVRRLVLEALSVDHTVRVDGTAVLGVAPLVDGAPAMRDQREIPVDFSLVSDADFSALKDGSTFSFTEETAAA